MRNISYYLRLDELKKLHIHPFFLYFTGEAAYLEKKFRNNYYEESRFITRIAIFLSPILFAIFHLMDIFMADLLGEEAINRVMFVRFAVIAPFFLMVFLISLTKLFQKAFHGILFICIVVGCTAVVDMYFHVPDNCKPYYMPGFILILIYGYIFSRIKFIYATLASWTVTGIFNFEMFFIYNTPDWIIINIDTYVFCMNFFGMLSAYFIEFNWRKAFFYNTLFSEEHEKLIHANQNLENSVSLRTKELIEVNIDLEAKIVEQNETEKIISSKNLELENYKNRLEIMVAEKTEDLKNINKKLLAEINERVLAEIQFRRFKAISDSANYGSAIINENMQIVYINAYFATIHGFTIEELHKRDIHLLYAKSNDQLNFEVESKLEEFSEYNALEVWHKKRNGEQFPMLQNAKRIGEKDNYYSITAIDITDLKKSQKEIIEQQNEIIAQRNIAIKQAEEIENRNHDLLETFERSKVQQKLISEAMEKINLQNEKLEKANVEIQASVKLKEVFLANTSHEMRTPLNGIIGFNNLLKSTELNERQKVYVNHINTSGETLLHIINDLLDYSKIEAGKLTLEKINFSFWKEINDIIFPFKSKSLEKDIKLIVSIDESTIKYAIGDPVRLRQIIMNLLSNALKFTNPQGSISVSVNSKTIDHRALVSIEVADTGIGIDKSKLEKLFQSFTQLDSNTTRLYGGTGLGLSIVQKLLELLEGKIEVDSKLGKGTTFKVFIPYEIGKELDKPELIHTTRLDNNCHPKNIRILLAEDMELNRELVITLFRNWESSIIVDQAENGQEAINKLKQSDYDLILMDIQMPLLDGFKASEIIRNEFEEPKRSTPIIALTANAMTQEKEKSLSIGINDYISKPFKENELFTKVKIFTCKNNKQRLLKKQPVEPCAFDCGQTKIEPGMMNEEKTIKKNVVEATLKSDFDLSQLYKIYRGNTIKIRDVLQKFLDEMPKHLDEMNKAERKSDFEAVGFTAHLIKTFGNYLGNIELQNLAKEIESGSKDPEKSKLIAGKIAILNNIWVSIKSQIIQHLGEIDS